MSVKQVLHTDLAPAAVGPYSQAIAASKMIFTSGQIPINPNTGKIEATTIEEQTEFELESGNFDTSAIKAMSKEGDE